MASKEDSYAIIGKIIQYSRDGNLNKLKKYLIHAQRFCTSSSGNHTKRFEVVLRENGALEAIHTLLNKLVDKYLINSVNKHNSAGGVDPFYKTPQSDVFIGSLTILGNAFAVDHKSRENASKSFLKTLEKIIPKIELKEQRATEILKKAIKCLANLCNASGCLYTVLRSKMETPDTLLDTVDKLYMKISYPVSDSESEEIRFMDKESYDLLSATVRALRILSSCNDSSAYRASFQKRCITTVGNILTWKFHLQDELRLEIIRILTSLSDKPKLVSNDIFNTPLVSNPDSTITGQIVKIFIDSRLSNQKLHSATIRCLQNISKDPYIASKLGFQGLLDAILNILEIETDKTSIGQVIKLLAVLTKSSENKYQLSKCSKFGSTLKILKNLDCKEFHTTILSIYESLFEQSLTSLLSVGIVDVLNEILLEEGGKMDSDILGKRISSLDVDYCIKHKENGCPFEPKFRCSSPSYQQVQKDMDYYMKARETYRGTDGRELQTCKSDVWTWTYSGSPPSSPSWSSASSSGFSSPRSDCESNYNDSSSDVRSRSPFACEFSDDEGNASLSSSEVLSPDQIDSDGNENVEGPLRKRFKLDETNVEQFCGQTAMIPGKADNINEPVNAKSNDERKASAKKIVAVLGILHQYTLLKPFPVDLVKVTPALLSIILSAKITIGLVSSGKMSIGESQWDSECKSLGRRSFELSFKILKTMFLSISTFHQLVSGETISLLYRMFTLPKYLNGSIDSKESQHAIVEADFHNYCDLLLKALTGTENDTAGWREGFLIRQLIISQSKNEIECIALNIPLIYRIDNQSFKNFRHQGKYWEIIFDILAKSEDISFVELQGCILALSSLCETMGMTWSDRDSRSDEPVLKRRRHCLDTDMETVCEAKDSFILFEMADGSTVQAEKEMLTNASPVFGAMFNGYFIETGQKRAKIQDVSKAAVIAFIEQIKCLQEEARNLEIENEATETHDDYYELSTLFDLLTLSDQYLLENIYRRTLNTLLRFYICFNSAPVIYTHAVRRSSLLKPDEKNQMQHMDLSYLILKYLLVAKDISVTAKCGAFWKIFDTVSHLTVVSDLRTLIESHVFNRKVYSNRLGSK